MTAAKLPRHAAALRWLFVALLAATGIAKLLDMAGFVAIVASYRAIPVRLLGPSAWALTVTELSLAAWLMWGHALSRAGALLVALHALYLLWLLIALARGLAIDNCGCFGVYFTRPLTWFTPLEDMILLTGAWIFQRSARKAGP